MNAVSYGELLVDLEEAGTPDRRLDSLVTACLLGPPGAHLDDGPGLDGWDIVMSIGKTEEPDVWMAADEVLYATQYVDSAVELCEAACPQSSAGIVARAVRTFARRAIDVRNGADLAGHLARQILIELIKERSVAPAQTAAAA